MSCRFYFFWEIGLCGGITEHSILPKLQKLADFLTYVSVKASMETPGQYKGYDWKLK